MKRLFVFFTVFALIFAFAGCEFEDTLSDDSTIASGYYNEQSSEQSNSKETVSISDAEVSSSDTVESREEESESPSSLQSSSKASSSTTSSQKPSGSSSKTESTGATSKPSSTVQSTTPTSQMVWIPTNGGKKYHSKSTCSGMKSPEKVTKDEAISLGFGPCGRCY